MCSEEATGEDGAIAVQKLLDAEVSVPEAVVRVLEQAGIEYVFGKPGGGTGRIFNALNDHQHTIRAVLVREEGLGAVMTDVYGRLTGKPGVVMAQLLEVAKDAGVSDLGGGLPTPTSAWDRGTSRCRARTRRRSTRAA
jgi:hypothetical protein